MDTYLTKPSTGPATQSPKSPPMDFLPKTLLCASNSARACLSGLPSIPRVGKMPSLNPFLTWDSATGEPSFPPRVPPSLESSGR